MFSGPGGRAASAAVIRLIGPPQWTNPDGGYLAQEWAYTQTIGLRSQIRPPSPDRELYDLDRGRAMAGDSILFTIKLSELRRSSTNLRLIYEAPGSEMASARETQG